MIGASRNERSSRAPAPHHEDCRCGQREEEVHDVRGVVLKRAGHATGRRARREVARALSCAEKPASRADETSGRTAHQAGAAPGP